MARAEFYTSIDHDFFKQSQVNFLLTQQDCIRVMKRLDKIKKIRREKNAAKNRFFKSANLFAVDLNKFEKELPELQSLDLPVELPKDEEKPIFEEKREEIKESGKKEEKKITKKEEKKKLSRDEKIEGELRAIQEKLRYLNR